MNNLFDILCKLYYNACTVTLFDFSTRLGGKNMKRIILVLLILCFVLLFLPACGVAEVEESNVVGVVTSKEYHPAYTTFMHIHTGKISHLQPQHHPAQYLVTIEYEDISTTFNNKELYATIDTKQKIDVLLWKGYNKKHELIKTKLLLPEE